MKTSPVLQFFCLYLCFNEVTSKRFVRNVEATKGTASKIAGGFYSDIEDVPYQVFIETDKENESKYCGGSILNENYILTTAHCLQGTNEVYAYIGQTKITPGTEDQAYYSTTFFIHESYDPRTYDYDAGLIYIDSMTLDGVTTKAIELVEPNTPLPISSPIRIAGYGNVSSGDSDDYYEDNVSRYLRYVEVPIMDQDDCTKAYSQYIEITPRQFCGSSDGARGPCQGDNGGAAILVGTNTQVGISSLSFICSSDYYKYPSLYINIADPDIRSFIDKYIQSS